jgi:hypothetical protein
MAENENVPQEPTEEPQGTEQVDWEAKFKELQAQSRKWEERAKANKDKADKWDAYEQEGMSEAEKLAKRAESAEAELAQLKADAQRRADAHEIAEANGVPEHLLSFCANREAMEAFAKEYAASREHVPAAASAAPSRVLRGNEGKQTTRDRFASYFDE